MTDIMDLFPDKVMPEPNSGCWLWDGVWDTPGYAFIHLNRRQMAHTSANLRRTRGHRLSYELSCGPIPPKHDVDHLCRVRCCVNPAHLEPVTERENTLRSPITLAGENHRKTHCNRGHELSGWNLIVLPSKGTPGQMHERRACRTCMYARIEERRRREREEKRLIRGGCAAP